MCSGSTQTPEEQVQVLIDEIEELVNSDVIGNGEANSLISKLSNALASIDRDNTNAANGQLGAFVNQIESLIESNQIESEIGQLLIDAVELIVTNLNS